MRTKSYISCLAVTLLCSCSLAPDFQVPKTDTPKAYKEEQDKWLPANTQAADISRGAWWKVYKDADLDTLEDKVVLSNQNLKAAVARYDEARALAAQARSRYFPTITAASGAEHERVSKTVAQTSSTSQFNDFLAGADLSYEIDIWGKVRNEVKSQENLAKASAADLAAMELSLHAELAMDYFALRGDDAAQVVLDESVAADEKALKLVEDRHTGGIASETDVDQAKTQLETAKTQAADKHIKRAQLEHAIAVLAGEIPSGFTIETKKMLEEIPPVVPNLPSTLLEQRPDIAAASLQLESANADIGVARAAYYPDFTFDGAFGVESAVLGKLFTAPSMFWSFGPAAAMPLFDGGRINALNDQARAAYNESIANYRQTVLSAFQQVEDALVALHQLEQEDTSQKAASAAAQKTLAQATDRYQGGIATPLDVTVAQIAALQSQMASIDVTTRHFTTSVMLIKALGGGWHAGANPH